MKLKRWSLKKAKKGSTSEHHSKTGKFRFFNFSNPKVFSRGKTEKEAQYLSSLTLNSAPIILQQSNSSSNTIDAISTSEPPNYLDKTFGSPERTSNNENSTLNGTEIPKIVNTNDSRDEESQETPNSKACEDNASLCTIVSSESVSLRDNPSLEEAQCNDRHVNQQNLESSLEIDLELNTNKQHCITDLHPLKDDDTTEVLKDDKALPLENFVGNETIPESYDVTVQSTDAKQAGDELVDTQDGHTHQMDNKMTNTQTSKQQMVKEKSENHNNNSPKHSDEVIAEMNHTSHSADSKLEKGDEQINKDIDEVNDNISTITNLISDKATSSAIEATTSEQNAASIQTNPTNKTPESASEPKESLNQKKDKPSKNNQKDDLNAQSVTPDQKLEQGDDEDTNLVSNELQWLKEICDTIEHAELEENPMDTSQDAMKKTRDTNATTSTEHTLRVRRHSSSRNERLRRLSFCDIIGHEDILNILMAFATKSFNGESLELWLEIEKYNAMLSKSMRMLGIVDGQSHEMVENQVQHIWNTYLAEDSIRWVCLDSKTQDIIKTRLESKNYKHTEELFLEVQQFLERDLKGDLFIRFKNAHREELLELEDTWSGKKSISARRARYLHTYFTPKTDKSLKVEKILSNRGAFEKFMKVAQECNAENMVDFVDNLHRFDKLKRYDKRYAEEFAKWISGMFVESTSCKQVQLECKESEKVVHLIEVGNIIPNLFEALETSILAHLQTHVVNLFEQRYPDVAKRIMARTVRRKTYHPNRMSEFVHKIIRERKKTLSSKALHTLEDSTLSNQEEFNRLYNQFQLNGNMYMKSMFDLYRNICTLENTKKDDTSALNSLASMVWKQHLSKDGDCYVIISKRDYRQMKAVVDCGPTAYFPMMFLPAKHSAIQAIHQFYERRKNRHINQLPRWSKVAESLGNSRKKHAVYLENILGHPTMFNRLYVFAERHQMCEGLDLLIDIDQYTKMDDFDSRKAKAQKIWDQYLAYQSPRWVCLNSGVQKKIEFDMQQGDFKLNLFGIVEKAVFRDMEGDLFLRFYRAHKSELEKIRFNKKNQPKLTRNHDAHIRLTSMPIMVLKRPKQNSPKQNNNLIESKTRSEKLLCNQYQSEKVYSKGELSKLRYGKRNNTEKCAPTATEQHTIVEIGIQHIIPDEKLCNLLKQFARQYNFEPQVVKVDLLLEIQKFEKSSEYQSGQTFAQFSNIYDAFIKIGSRNWIATHYKDYTLLSDIREKQSIPENVTEMTLFKGVSEFVSMELNQTLVPAFFHEKRTEIDNLLGTTGDEMLVQKPSNRNRRVSATLASFVQSRPFTLVNQLIQSSDV